MVGAHTEEMAQLQAEVAKLRAEVGAANKRELRQRLRQIAEDARAGRLDGFQVAAALHHAIGAWL